MYNFELQDLLFLIKSLKSPTDNMITSLLLEAPQDLDYIKN